ncbi:MAG: putative ABC transporter permease [Gemmiger sp.]|uniref:putative ABC transporter permease n=1 Tax=Gemmiger sp. TaxID=2049027 RepID=UPI002E7A471F|nr:putative ABC transporter permease [Gemmiger sp.]MEE0801150.1 putative ABC transporter permease [Gemmiger sp.]
MLYRLFWLFLAFSFLGWLIEVSFVALRRHRYQDRGVLHGPLCLVYGFAGCLVTVGLRDLTGSWFFLFVGSALYATVIEWVAGHLLERFTRTRWWDYSGQRFNLDGYISLTASLIWGVLGVVSVKWLVPLLLRLYALPPAGVMPVLLWIVGAILAADILGTLLALTGTRDRLPQLDAVNNRLAGVTLRLGLWILDRTEHHIRNIAPAADLARQRRVKSAVFAEGCCFSKIFLLFVIGALAGDLTETIFCRLTAGYWMSRSSLVWGPFSIVWGLAIGLVTLLLYKYKDRPAFWLFGVGTLLGGAYEYLCSVFTEIVFGAVFWDYSALPFNLGGRINLLYCFFWGLAAVVWFKVLLPPLDRLIERIPRLPGQLLTAVLVVFMTANMLVSAAALIRYDSRSGGAPAANRVEVLLDEHFDDARMKQIYPKLVRTD